MAEPNDQQGSGFWTLTRPSKLSKRRNSDLHELHHKVFNISVVGLSGPDKDKGPIGIGKSCLCNRFFRSAADDYQSNHISVLSQTDFSGRIVNNDHWLYWGSVIKSCDGCDLAFNVIEQTEFVDDSCFQPFKSGKIEPYFKRCANTKPVSAEKLMYICKNQLGVEREYEQRYLPDGKFNVDGFLCLFDVSEVQGRNIDKQIEITNLIMLNLIKTRKPVVFVTTKHDEASEILVAEAERLINQRDFRGLVPIVETSAQENVNVNIPFLVCAQLIDRTRAKIRIPSYFEAYNIHLDLLNAASDAYLNLIKATVIDYRTTWQQVCIKLSHNPEFLRYTYLHGLDKATTVFKNYLKRLRDECIHQKVDMYLNSFPAILDELVPINAKNHNGSINNNTHETKFSSSSSGDLSHHRWAIIKEQLESHPLFDKYFVRIPPECNWYDTELLQSDEIRIPSDWLNSEDAYSVFQRRTMFIEAEQKRQDAKELFKQMLLNIKIPVGQPFIELKHLFSGTPELGLLNDQELFEIYVEYQNNLLQQARADFQELLLENADHLNQLASSNRVIRQEDIQTINAILQYDERYQALDRFSQDRTLMIIRHLSFLHGQLSEKALTPSQAKIVETNNQQQPPGKLDLSQFENITTAIGKLKVQSRALPEIPTSKQQSKSSHHHKSHSNSDQQAKQNQQPPPPPQHQEAESSATSEPSSFFKGLGKKTKTQTKDLRQNHGRAVAPPQLPSGIGNQSNSVKLLADSSRYSPAHGSFSQLVIEDTGLDFNQSPIAQRLLKNSKDHKVSELNSPYESDNEPSHSKSSVKAKINKVSALGSDIGDSSGKINPNSIFNNSSIDSSELSINRDAAIRELNKILANKPPRQPGSHNQLVSRGSSLEDEQQPTKPFASKISSEGKVDKESKKDKKKSKDDEKLEKKRLKEEERQRREERRQEKKALKKTKSALASSSVGSDGVPYFIKRCIEFIEEEGLDAEGIYRVPGNRAHVDAFVQKFKENPDMSIDECDVPVNAVATALKDFLSKKWGPIIPLALMNELTELSNISDKEERVQAVRNLVNKLPPANYKLLKYVFSHFVKVSHNHSLNSMDSKNLAICWWPTLLPLHFSDMVMFEQMRPHLEESIQTMIDQFELIFEGDEPSSSPAS